MKRPEKADELRQRARRPALAAVALVALVLAGCSSLENAVNPVAWYRDLTGSSKSDDQDTGRNIKNFAEGGKEPYPNLASVPPPPGNALSATEREALQQSLVADRQNAKYTNDQLRAGIAPPPSSTPEEPKIAMVSASPSGASNGTPPAGVSAPAAAAPAAPSPGQRPVSASRRSSGRGTEAPPQESSLASPSVRSVPAGEAPRPAPPAPDLPPSPPAEAKAPAPVSSVAARTPVVAPPPPTSVAPTQPPPTPAAARSPAAKSPLSLQVAQISFSSGSTEVSSLERQKLIDVAKLHQEHGGTIRVVGYAARGSGSDAAQQELTNFGLALDRAKAVAQTLTGLGVPSNAVAVEAAPLVASATSDEARAEIFLNY